MAILDRSSPFQSDLFINNIHLPYLTDNALVTNFSRFMGPSNNSIIYKILENKGQGDQIIFPLSQIFRPNVARGNQPLEGTEQEETWVTDRVRIDTLRWATKITNQQLIEIQTKISPELKTQITQTLLEQADILYTERILNTFGFAFDGGFNQNSFPTNYTYDKYSELTQRILNSRLDSNEGGVSRARILIGDPNVANSNSRTTYATLTNALVAANFPVATHKMNISHIRQLANQAMTGKSLNISDNSFTVQESALKPYQQQLNQGFLDKRYVLFIAPETYSQLTNDPLWQAQLARGIIENKDQPSVIYGSMYKGTIEGVMIIVIPEFSNLIITNGAGNNYAYSVLCGASAIGLGTNVPQFKLGERDYEHYIGLAHVEISGMKALKYPSKYKGVRGNNNNLVEYGLIHSFTTIS
jgi:hypothetical protein